MVQQISLQGFRNIASVSTKFECPLVVFYGQNGQGKTNLLEALAIVACGSSFRDQKKHLWLPFGADQNQFASIVLSTDEGITHRVVVAAPAQSAQAQVKFWRNDIPVSLADFIGEIPVVVFRPEDMNLFILDPTLRRSFLDSVLFQVFPLYRQAYSQAKKTLVNRNALLKSIQKGEAVMEELSFWNEQYLQYSAVLQQYRALLLSYLDKELATVYQQFSHVELPLKVQYQKSLFEPEANVLLERSRGFTLSGSHRDDFCILAEGSEVPWTITASRGEMRTLILALKSMLVMFLAEKLEQKPIVLLDDVLSEFDDERQELVLSWKADYQLFITVAGNIKQIKDAQMIKVENGQVV